MYAADFRQRARLAPSELVGAGSSDCLAASLLGAELLPPLICKSSWIPLRFSSSS